ncbi:hypothetical protein [Mastigocladopsis repens]|uniref:hypothetical protein n=1 Tax=Mastigocladopsis repens TaxID=221287 RepID=UPI0002FA97ED|nr:hypothetical protein [Mastigocladopsis repens]
MIRLTQILAIGTISILAFTGCNSAEQATTQPSPAATSASGVEASKQETSPGGVEGLLGVVSNTRVAVEAGDFAKAKEEFQKFEDNWQKVEDGIKAKSPDSYEAIEDSADEITGALKGSAPSKEKVMPQLQSLEKNINGVAKL